VSFYELPDEARKIASEYPHIGYAEIDGADHGYTNRTDQLWTEVHTWYEAIDA
jgi:hypothetical protein